MRKLFLGFALFLVISGNVLGQSAIVRGEVSPGVYETIKTDGAQSLNVNVTGSSAAGTSLTWTHSAPTVTNSSGSLIAANTSRKAILIQNNHATGILYLNLAGGTATTSNIALQPGMSLFLNPGAPVTAIFAIGSVASNTAIAVVSGQ